MAASRGRELISANEFGVLLDGLWIPGGTEGTRIQGNLIGTNFDGTAKLANRFGVQVERIRLIEWRRSTRSTDVLIGGTATGEGNLISGSFNEGVAVRRSRFHKIIIQGNHIGTDIDGRRRSAMRRVF